MSRSPGRIRLPPRQQRLPVDQANDRTGHVARAGRVDVRHLSCLAPKERAARRRARFGRTRDDCSDVFRHKLVNRDIVEEEERPRALHEDVIETVVDNVRADTLPATVRRRQFDLRADAIRRSHQQRLRRQIVQREQAAETVGLSHHVRGCASPARAACISSTAFLPHRPPIDVHACSRIAAGRPMRGIPVPCCWRLRRLSGKEAHSACSSIDSNQLTVEGGLIRDNIMDAPGQTFEVRIECARDDAAVQRRLKVQPNEMSAIQSQDGPVELLCD